MELLIILLLILINGFFSLSEIAVISSKETRLNQARLTGSKGAVTALKLRDDSENFLSSVQVGITLVGLITGATVVSVLLVMSLRFLIKLMRSAPILTAFPFH